MRTKPTLFTALAMTAMIPAGAMAAGERCTGQWGGAAPTSVAFTGGNSLLYCFRADCWPAQWSGSRGGTLTFRIAATGAVVTLTRTASGYDGVWNDGRQTTGARFTCQ